VDGGGVVDVGGHGLIVLEGIALREITHLFGHHAEDAAVGQGGLVLHHLPFDQVLLGED
jgi:hypothetical protein